MREGERDSFSLDSRLGPHAYKNDDYWRYALFAAVGLIRAAADLRGIPAAQLAGQIADSHGITDAS